MKTKNLLFAGAIALSTVMSPVAALVSSTPVFAENYTVSNPTTHDYTAFQILSGAQATGDSALGSVGWGSDVDTAAMATYLSGSTYFSGCDTPQSVVDVLNGKGDNSPEALEFAKIASKSLKTDSKGIEIKAGAKSVTANPGYYLLVDQYEGTDDNHGVSLLQITNKGDIVISLKSGKPELDKKVEDEKDENDHSKGKDLYYTADHEIGEVFGFELSAKIPAKTMDKYDSYKLVFTDTLSDGVDFGLDKDGNLNGFEVKVGNTPITVVKDATTGNSYSIDEKVLTVTIPNVKSHVTDYAAEVTVYVKYNAKLNASAGITDNSEGNEKLKENNKVGLQFSNNPNYDGSGDLGTIPEKQVFVGTYKLPNTKIGDNDNDKKLEGAQFILKNSDNKYAVVDAGTVTGWTDNESNASRITSNAQGDFSVSGLDAGKYILIEKVAPAGYNVGPNVEVIITAEHDHNNRTDTVTKLEYQQDESDPNTSGVVISNNKGGTLPETGGMGTTMIYGVGTVLVAGAAIAFVTNKRMKKED